MKKITLIALMLFTALSYAQGIELNGTISAENNQIKNLQDPTEAQDAVTLSVLLEKISALQDQIDNAQIGSITDVDGNTYNSLTYGDQVWTVEKAEMVTYRDGTPIPQVTDGTAWSNLTTGAWAYYNNDPTKPRLYNWFAVMGIHDTDPNTPNKEFAPEGWHVPTDAEWTTLENYLIANGYNYDDTTTENKIAKAMASTTGWISSTETGAIGKDQSLNNDSGFNAFPEGYRSYDGSFSNEGNSAVFWSSTEYSTSNAWGRNLYYNYSLLNRINSLDNEQYGFSVRFVRD
ncbi:fibrobacter succinogenes major paralogous domain-containing protein [bacterium]|nr:fibrobacter succinogenes major paralogous domain-containing protein [bacterium]